MSRLSKSRLLWFCVTFQGSILSPPPPPLPGLPLSPPSPLCPRSPPPRARALSRRELILCACARARDCRTKHHIFSEWVSSEPVIGNFLLDSPSRGKLIINTRWFYQPSGSLAGFHGSFHLTHHKLFTFCSGSEHGQPSEEYIFFLVGFKFEVGIAISLLDICSHSVQGAKKQMEVACYCCIDGQGMSWNDPEIRHPQ